MEKAVSLWGGGIVLLCGGRQQSAGVESVLYLRKVRAGALIPRLKQNSSEKQNSKGPLNNYNHLLIC